MKEFTESTTGSVLLTSFTTWKPEQRSNASDDLFDLLLNHPELPLPFLHFLRKIPVDFTLATYHTIHCIETTQPAAVICCGMGENRSNLTVESRGVRADQVKKTTVDLPWLIEGLEVTEVSHDAGQFVCNSLYFDVLAFLQHYYPLVPCIFVHVPRLTSTNQHGIVEDFLTILNRIRSLQMPCPLTSAIA